MPSVTMSPRQNATLAHLNQQKEAAAAAFTTYLAAILDAGLAVGDGPIGNVNFDFDKATVSWPDKEGA